MGVVLYGGAVGWSGLVYPAEPICLSVLVTITSLAFFPHRFLPIGFLLPSSSFISLPLLTLSLASSLPLSAFALHQCPEERGGAFQRPGDHSPLSASGPQSDRGIRIRIAVHSPQCPSDELEGAREGETEGAGGRRGMKGGAGVSRTHSVLPLVCGIPSVFTSLPSVSSLFYAFWRTYTPHMCMHA